MAECRDWLSSLFPASWNGVPFFVARDGEDGGRRVIVHEFPLRDDPFLEDIGEAPRYFDVEAYVASDAADAEAAGLVAVLTAGGPGVLVLPSHGPIPARCMTFKRARERDRAGFISFSLRFVREGVAGPLASVLSIANLVFAAADRIADQAGLAFAASVSLVGRPDYVFDAAVSGLRDGIAVLDEIRATNAVEAAASADLGLRAAALSESLPARLGAVSGPAIAVPEFIAIAREIGDAMAPADAARAFGDVADQAVLPDPVGLTGTALEAARNRIEAVRVVRLAALSAYVEAVIRAPYPSRREAVTARADLVERTDAELARSGGYALAEVIGGIRDLQGRAVEYLTRQIVDLAPVVRVEGNLRLPSLWWAHRLYADPNRAGELVARNNVVHPGFMPLSFEALAS